jgi:hypothetical protein
MGKGGKGASGAAAAKAGNGKSSDSKGGASGAKSKEQESPHAWKPIDRSFFRSSPLENSGVFLLSELPISILHMEHDWAIKKKNVRLAIWALTSIITMIVELEMAFNTKKLIYEKREICEGLKGFLMFQTVMMLYYLYDLYDYMIAGAKKDWYHILYKGENPGPVPKFSHHMGQFITEFAVVALHAPPYFDFRHWRTGSGAVKPFVSDKLGVFVFLRVYLFVRVVRDYTDVYARRRLIYDSGHKANGGCEIRALTAVKTAYLKHTAVTVAILAGGSILMLAYMAHVAERDWQPEQFAFKNCVWYVTFFVAAMDYGSMGPKSQFGTGVSVLIVSWGLILLSMAIGVIFESASLSSYEVWAIDWLKQCELLEQERIVAADMLTSWVRHKKSMKNQREGQEKYSETMYKLNAVKKYKLLMEIQFKIERAGGGDAGIPQPKRTTEAAITLSDSAKEIRAHVEQDDGSALQSRLAAINAAHDVILQKLQAKV